ncbi:hypothetical protein FQN54_006470 [Arachnomyces sp. PD_36]|nr:hypothetical protein FQN54_006470 [Arachnomyces sp. PD_36]
MPAPSSRSSRPAARRVRFATTATVYGEDCSPASAPVRGGPRLVVRPRRSGPSSSSTKSATTSTAARSSSAAPRPRIPSVESSDLSDSSQPFRSVSFARAAARSPSPAPAPAPTPAPRRNASSGTVERSDSSDSARPFRSVAFARAAARPSSRPSPPAPAPAAPSRPASTRLTLRSSRARSRVSPPAPSAPSAPSPPSPPQSSTISVPVVSRSASLLAASTRSSSASSASTQDSRPLVPDSVTRRLDDVESGIRQLRGETRRILDDGHRLARPTISSRTRTPRTTTTTRTTSEATALAIPRPRHPSPTTQELVTAARGRGAIKTPGSDGLRVPKARAPIQEERPRRPTPATAEVVTRSRARTPAKAPAKAADDTLQVERTRPHARAPAKAPAKAADATLQVERTRPHARPLAKAPAMASDDTLQVERTRPRARPLAKAPAMASDDSLQVERTRPHARPLAKAPAKAASDTLQVERTRPRPRIATPQDDTTQAPAQDRSIKTCFSARTSRTSRTTSQDDTKTSGEASKTSGEASFSKPAEALPLSASARSAIKRIDDLLARFPSRKPKSCLRTAGSGLPPRSVRINDCVETTIVERWITREDVHSKPPAICGALQGWSTAPLPEPTAEGEDTNWNTFWCSMQCSQLTHSHYRPCGRQCAWNELARIQRSGLTRNCEADDHLAFHSTREVFRAFNARREKLRARGMDLP